MTAKPNIVYFLADDLGIGDVSCLNPSGKIRTSSFDRLAREGMGWEIEEGESLVPPHEYDAAPGGHLRAGEAERRLFRRIFEKPVTAPPTSRGFDYYFGVDVPNWPPYCFIENDSTMGIPSEYLPSRLLGNNLASLQGPALPDWRFEELLPTFAERADRYITERAASGSPFFLYVAATSPHTPLCVNEPWIGRSGLDSHYADLVLETDAFFGSLLSSLERNNLRDDTLVIFASDNGCAPYIGVGELEAQGHFPSAQFRGYKSDAWDGGHRIPLIVRWPGVIEEGSICEELVSLSDLIATCAEIVGSDLPGSAGEDSISMLPLFCKRPGQRDLVVHHSIDGKFAVRDRRWKLVLCPGSGGWTKPDAEAAREGLPLVQLYDMESDPGERVNLQRSEPAQVRRLLARLTEVVGAGQNDVDVDIWKLDTMPTVRPEELDDL